MAQKLRPRKVSDFASLEHLRHDLISSINDYRREQSEFLIGRLLTRQLSDRAMRSFCESGRGRWVAKRAAWLL